MQQRDTTSRVSLQRAEGTFDNPLGLGDVTIIDDKAAMSFDEVRAAESLQLADKYMRDAKLKCWADMPKVDPKVEYACNDTDTSTCVLGLCPKHCIDIHGGCNHGV